MYRFHEISMWFSELSQFIAEGQPISKMERNYNSCCTDSRSLGLLRRKLHLVNFSEAVALQGQLSYIRSREDLLANGHTAEGLLATFVNSVIIRNELNRLGKDTVDTILGLMLQVDYMHRQGVLPNNDHALLTEWLDKASGHVPQAVQQAEVLTLYEGDIGLDWELVNGDVTFEPNDPRIDPLVLGSLCSKPLEEAECSICLGGFGKLRDALLSSLTVKYENSVYLVWH